MSHEESHLQSGDHKSHVIVRAESWMSHTSDDSLINGSLPVTQTASMTQVTEKHWGGPSCERKTFS